MLRGGGRCAREDHEASALAAQLGGLVGLGYPILAVALYAVALYALAKRLVRPLEVTAGDDGVRLERALGAAFVPRSAHLAGALEQSSYCVNAASILVAADAAVDAGDDLVLEKALRRLP